MSESAFPPLSPTESLQIEKLCTRFELAWEAWQHRELEYTEGARIEDYRAKVPETLWPVLLRKLLALEATFQLHDGEIPMLNESGERSSQEKVAKVAELAQRWLDAPGSDELCAVAVWKMGGYSDKEIAEKLGCPKTIRPVLHLELVRVVYRLPVEDIQVLVEYGERFPKSGRKFATEVADRTQRLMDAMDSDELRVVAVWKMEGYRNQEIAAKLGCVERSVERRLRLIRGLLEREMEK